MTNKIKKRTVRKRPRKKKKSDRKVKLILISVTAVCLGIAAFFLVKDHFGREEETFDSNKYFVKGIDLSHHNPILNWDNIMEQGISFAYMKATEGTSHEDRNYSFNYELARKSNVRIGSYHFYTFSLSGKEQAQYFLKTAQFNTGDLLPAIDVEHSPANPYSKDAEYISVVVEELKVLENELYLHFGIHPLIYTNKDCYKLYIKGNFPENIIWMCDLDKEPDENLNWRIWQFTHKGEIPGIDGNIDLNYYRYTFNEFKELLLP